MPGGCKETVRGVTGAALNHAAALCHACHVTSVGGNRSSWNNSLCKYYRLFLLASCCIPAHSRVGRGIWKPSVITLHSHIRSGSAVRTERLKTRPLSYCARKLLLLKYLHFFLYIVQYFFLYTYIINYKNQIYFIIFSSNNNSVLCIY